MKIVFCIEASYERGLGHFYRSTRLAKEWQNQKIPAEILFLVNQESGIENLIQSSSIQFKYYDKSEIDWEQKVIDEWRPEVWINDRLDTDADHAKKIKDAIVKLVTFDDRGTGASFSDINVCPLIFDEIVKGKKCLMGPEFLVVEERLFSWKRTRHELKNILVAMGGTDNHFQTLMALELIKDDSCEITALLGPLNRQELEIEKKFPRVKMIKNPKELGLHFQKADLMFSAGGMMPFEALATGLPVIATASEEFERPVCQFIEKTGAGIYAGFRNDLQNLNWLESRKKIQNQLKKMSLLAEKTVDNQAALRLFKEIST